MQNAFKTIRNGLESLIRAKANFDVTEEPKKLEKQVKQELVIRLKAIQE